MTRAGAGASDPSRSSHRRRSSRHDVADSDAELPVLAEIELDPLAAPLTAPSRDRGSVAKRHDVDPRRRRAALMFEAFMAQHSDPEAAMAALVGATARIPRSGPSSSAQDGHGGGDFSVEEAAGVSHGDGVETAGGVSAPTESESGAGSGGNYLTPAGRGRGGGGSSKPPSAAPTVDADSALPSRHLQVPVAEEVPTRALRLGHRGNLKAVGRELGCGATGTGLSGGLGSVGCAFGPPLPLSSRRAGELQQRSKHLGNLKPARADPPYLQAGVQVVTMGGGTTADWLVNEQRRQQQVNAKRAAKAKKGEEKST